MTVASAHTLEADQAIGSPSSLRHQELLSSPLSPYLKLPIGLIVTGLQGQRLKLPRTALLHLPGAGVLSWYYQRISYSGQQRGTELLLGSLFPSWPGGPEGKGALDS